MVPGGLFDLVSCLLKTRIKFRILPSSVMNLPVGERLAFLDRPVPPPLIKLKLFCVYYDFICEKVMTEAKHKRSTRIIREVNERLEQVSETFTRRTTASSYSSSDIGRAI